jgi:hypothetical protein
MRLRRTVLPLVLAAAAFGVNAQTAGAETIVVSNTNGTPVASKTVLEPGHRYRLVARGTVSDWCPASAKKKEQCSYGSPLEVAQGVDSLYCYAKWRCPTKELWRQLRVNGQGLDEIADQADDVEYSAGHTYTVEITGIKGRLSFVSSDAAAGSTGDNSGSFTVTLTEIGGSSTASKERFPVIFSSTANGINGRIQFQTVGPQDAKGGWVLKRVYLTGSSAELTATVGSGGIFGGGAVGLDVVSARYEPRNGFGGERVVMRVRVNFSADSACPVGAKGVISVFEGRRAGDQPGAFIELCGKERTVLSEKIFINALR